MGFSQGLNKNTGGKPVRSNARIRTSVQTDRVPSAMSPAVDETLLGKRIEFLSEFDMDEEGTEKEPRWCSGVVERICDGTWVIPGKVRKCWKEGEAVEVFWDAIPDADMPACRDNVALNPNKWNKDVIDAWRMDLGEYNYGV